MNTNTTRRNRRAVTWGAAVRENRIFDIVVMVDGYATKRSAHYYRRIASPSYRYTGPAPIGSVHGHFTQR